MFVTAIRYPISTTQNQPKNKVHSSNISFNAMRTPSGEYSDWFYTLVNSLKRLTKEEITPAVNGHVYAFKNSLRDGFWKKVFCSQEKAESFASKRKSDFYNLHSDLRSGNKAERTGSKSCDYPNGRYSSSEEYELRNPEPSSSSDDDFFNNDGGGVGAGWDAVKRDS